MDTPYDFGVIAITYFSKPFITCRVKTTEKLDGNVNKLAFRKVPSAFSLKRRKHFHIQASKATLRPTASQPVCQAPNWDPRPILLLLCFIISYTVKDFLCGGPSLTRSRFCSFCFWASPVQPFSGWSPTGLKNTFYCFYFWDSPNLEGQIPVFICHRQPIAVAGHELFSPAPTLRSWVRIPLRHGCLCVICVRFFCFYSLKW
jgi:hypothetical protein